MSFFIQLPKMKQLRNLQVIRMQSLPMQAYVIASTINLERAWNKGPRTSVSGFKNDQEKVAWGHLQTRLSFPHSGEDEIIYIGKKHFCFQL